MQPREVKFWQGCRASLKFFTVKALGLKWPKHYSEWEQTVESSPRSLTQAPRGSWKTYFFSLAYPLWRILRGKTEVLMVSDSEDQARKNLRMMRQFIENNEVLAPMRPTTKELWGTDQVSFPNGSLVTIMGFGTSRRGTHPDIIIPDDIESESSKMSRADRDRMFFAVISGMALPHTKICVVGTPLEFGDILAQLETNEAYAKWRRPAIIGGVNRFPDIWTDDWLDFRRKEMGSINFAREMLLERIDPSTQPFKRDFETLYDELPFRFSHTATVCDPAYTENDGDYTAIMTVKFTHGNHAYVVEAKRFRKEDPGMIVNELFKTIATQKPDCVGIPKRKGEAVSYSFKERRIRENRWDFKYVELPETQGKAHKTRIGGLVPRWESRSVHIHRNMKDLLDELYQFRLDDSHHHDDMCFEAGTLIATPFGDKPIETMKKGDKVITPFGVRSVEASGCTGERLTVSRWGLRATPNHPVFSNHKFAPIDALTHCFNGSRISLKEILSWKYRRLLNLMASNTVLWGRDAIILASQEPIVGGRIRKDFMSRFGNFILERKFRKVFTFTIKTAIISITAFLIWNAYRLGNITRCLSIWILKKSERISLGLDLLLSHGTSLLRDAYGMRNTLERYGLIRNSSFAFAFLAGTNFSLPTQCLDFVPTPVKNEKDEKTSAVLSSGSVLSVQKNFLQTNFIRSSAVPILAAGNSAGVAKKVYNLTVEKDHVYFANGVLVSNCDALAHCFNPEMAEPGGYKRSVPSLSQRNGHSLFQVGKVNQKAVDDKFEPLWKRLDRRVGDPVAA